MEIKRFSKWCPSAILNFRKLQFWTRVLYWHVILYFRSEFHINRLIRRRDIAKKRFSIWRPSTILNLKNFDFLSNFYARNVNLHLCTNFGRNRLIYSSKFGDTAIFKMAAVCHLEFSKIAVLVTGPVLPRDSLFSLLISHESANTAPRYSQKHFQYGVCPPS